jgi:hypothetical protein
LENWLRGENNIKIDLEVIRWEGVKWIDVVGAKDAWQAIANTLINHRSPEKAGFF